MILIGNNDKIILPYFYGEHSVIELEKPILSEYSVGVDTYRYGSSLEVLCKFICTNISITEYNETKDLFNSLSENLSVKELMEIVQDKLIKRKNNGRK